MKVSRYVFLFLRYDDTFDIPYKLFYINKKKKMTGFLENKRQIISVKVTCFFELKILSPEMCTLILGIGR